MKVKDVVIHSIMCALFGINAYVSIVYFKSIQSPWTAWVIMILSILLIILQIIRFCHEIKLIQEHKTDKL